MDSLLQAPDLSNCRQGNTGTVGVWHFDSGQPGQHLAITSLIHGNEICGAIVVKSLLEMDLRPSSGSLTLAFCNLAAFDRFDPAHPFDARFVEEDLNRQWSTDRFQAAHSLERRRAAELSTWLGKADWLLDLHSMHHEGEPVLLAGSMKRNLALAWQMGAPKHVVVDKGHATGTRLIDFGQFADAGRAQCRALLLEAGQHLDPQSVVISQDIAARFLICADVAYQKSLSAWVLPDVPAHQAQRLLLHVTGSSLASNSSASFEKPWRHLENVPAQNTLLGQDGNANFYSPHDQCYLLMPHLIDIQAQHTLMRYAQADVFRDPAFA
jgi:Succinylglutamate desuccinylase / Aspartoacylase family